MGVEKLKIQVSRVKWKWVFWKGVWEIRKQKSKSWLLNVTQHLRVSSPFGYGCVLAYSALYNSLCTWAEYSGQKSMFGWFLLFQEEPSVPVYCLQKHSVRIKSGSPFMYTVYSTNLPSSSSHLGLNFSSKCIYIYF